MEQFEDAITHYKTAYELNPEDPDICFNIGKCYHLLLDDQNARKWLEKAAHLYGPNFMETRNKGSKDA